MPAAALQRELHAPLLLTPAQLQFYRDNGFIRLKNVLSADLLAHYRDAVEAAVAAAGDAPLDAQQALDRADDDYAQAFLQVINLWRTSPDVREFVFGQRLAHVAAQLVKARAGGGVRLYHDQALFKAPGGGHTPWHCDQFYWPLASEKTVTAWVPLEAVPEEMGPLQFAAGSHRKDLGRAVGIGAASDRAVGEAVAAGGYELAGGGFELGDVSFHAGWTFHRAGANTSAATRKVMTIIYMDSGMRMAAPVNANQRADAARYLEGVAPGEVCAGPRNPLLWPRQEEAQETQAQEQVQAQAQAEAEEQAQAQAQAEGAGVGAV